jgi:5-formyltetrahydrofolate cyclo-ligase
LDVVSRHGESSIPDFSLPEFLQRFGRSAGSVSGFMTKNHLRQKLLSRRHALPADLVRAQSAAIQARFVATGLFQKVRSLGLYSPVNKEVLTAEIFSVALTAGKIVVFPRVRGCHLEFVEICGKEEFSKGVFGIPEPPGNKVLPLAEVDVLVVPGVAFDARGGRLGYGKGFYDRALGRPGRRPILVGICYEIQLVTSLPKEAHDVVMDVLVTERRLLWMKKHRF